MQGISLEGNGHGNVPHAQHNQDRAGVPDANPCKHQCTSGDAHGQLPPSGALCPSRGPGQMTGSITMFRLTNGCGLEYGEQEHGCHFRCPLRHPGKKRGYQKQTCLSLRLRPACARYNWCAAALSLSLAAAHQSRVQKQSTVDSRGDHASGAGCMHPFYIHRCDASIDIVTVCGASRRRC
jgi:hypothetical protein